MAKRVKISGGESTAYAHNHGLAADAVRAHDWGNSSLGPISSWSATLHTAVGIVLDAASPRVLLWGPDFISFCNDASLPVLGCLAAEGVGKPYPQVRGNAWQLVQDYVEAAMTGKGQVVTELHIASRVNESGYFTVCYSPIYDDQSRVAGVMESFVDTTAAHLSQKAADSEIRRFRRLFDQIPIYLIVTEGPDLRIEYANSAFRELAGGRELIDQNVSAAFPEAATFGIADLMTRVLETGDPLVVRDCALQFSGKSGRAVRLMLDFVFQPVLDAELRVTGVLCVSSAGTAARSDGDIGREKRAALPSSTRLGAVGLLAATLAHEITQPLTAASNYLAGSRMLLDRRQDSDMTAIQSSLAETATQIRRASEIIRQARTIVICGTAHCELVSLPELVDRAIRLVNAAEAAIDAEILLDLHPDASALYANPVQVEQVLMNLIRNAYQAMTESSECALTISSRRINADHAEIRVSDTGQGLPDTNGKILLASLASLAKGGLGLGIALSRTLIEAHGGMLWADNNPEGGASVHFTLPLARDLEMAA